MTNMMRWKKNQIRIAINFSFNNIWMEWKY